jgi:hypothetical protein
MAKQKQQERDLINNTYYIHVCIYNRLCGLLKTSSELECLLKKPYGFNWW